MSADLLLAAAADAMITAADERERCWDARPPVDACERRLVDTLRAVAEYMRARHYSPYALDIARAWLGADRADLFYAAADPPRHIFGA